jgi:hypothetical protein
MCSSISTSACVNIFPKDWKAYRSDCNSNGASARADVIGGCIMFLSHIPSKEKKKAIRRNRKIIVALKNYEA